MRVELSKDESQMRVVMRINHDMFHDEHRTFFIHNTQAQPAATMHDVGSAPPAPPPVRYTDGCQQIMLNRESFDVLRYI